MTKEGEKYHPPPSNSGVVSLNNCSVCLIPETCLVFLANATRVQPPRACKKAVATRSKQQLDSAGEDTSGKQIKDISESEIQEGENINACEGNMTLHPLQGCPERVHYMNKPNMLTKNTYVLPDTAEFGETFYNRIVFKSNTLAALVRKFMVIIQALVTFGPIAKKKMKDEALTMTKEFLQREAWRAILLCSQRYYSFKIL